MIIMGDLMTPIYFIKLKEEKNHYFKQQGHNQDKGLFLMKQLLINLLSTIKEHKLSVKRITYLK